MIFRKRGFQRALIDWYSRNGRDLPWRRTRDPYAILVSEFMLQQTQVASVLSYYNDWLRRFPDFAALARATENDVLYAWQGLGYYTRARNLHQTAKLIVHQHGGRFPRSIERMQWLPGIGKYTAHAVAAFALDQSVPIIEANTARVLARLFDVQVPIDQAVGRKTLWSYAASLMPKSSARVYNSALIDLGASICLPRPKCKLCPVRRFCRATNPELLPLKKPRPHTKALTENHAFVVSRNKILLQRAAPRWRGMWILPAIKFDRSNRSSLRSPIYASVFPFTNHRVNLRVFRRQPRKIDPVAAATFPMANNVGERWFSVSKLDSIPIPSPHRRAIVDLLNATRATRALQQRS